jgi:hypothetical protein
MSNSTPLPNDALTAATQMVKNGRLDQARDTLMQYLMKNPSSEQAWLLMSYVLSDPAKQKDCLERVLKINPNNTVAQSKLAHLLGRRTEELFQKQAEPPPPAPKPELEAEVRAEIDVRPEFAAVSPAEPEPRKPVRPLEAAKSSEPKPAPAPQPIPSAGVPPPEKSPSKAAKWMRLITIFLVVLVLGIVAVILYFNVLLPVVNSLNTTPTPTTTPISTLEFPTQWTQTLTPTVTITPIPTETPALSPVPSETTIL